MALQSEAPIFIQIIDKIKDDIMTGVYVEGELIISTTQISKLYSVNPATAQKSVALLQEEGIIYKKRGIGMCVAQGAPKRIKDERKNSLITSEIVNLTEKAKKLEIKKEELIKLISEVSDFD